jgi:hypothetical protein
MTAGRSCRHERVLIHVERIVLAALLTGAVGVRRCPRACRREPSITVIRSAALFHVEQQSGVVELDCPQHRPATRGRATSSLRANRATRYGGGLMFARIQSCAVHGVGQSADQDCGKRNTTSHLRMRCRTVDKAANELWRCGASARSASASSGAAYPPRVTGTGRSAPCGRGVRGALDSRRPEGCMPC